MSVETYPSFLEYSANPTTASTSDFLVFDVRHYYKLYRQAKESVGEALASKIVQQAISNDSVGLISEKVSSEKEGLDFIFSLKYRVRFQMTPSRHVYYQVEDKLVAPELMELSKDVLETISGWRRGLDFRAMTFLKDNIFQGEVGHSYTWGSAKAEGWEELKVRECQGKYGWVYSGRIEDLSEEDERYRQLLGDRVSRKVVVHGYKFGGEAQVLNHFLNTLPGELVQAPSLPDDKFVDTTMTSLVVSEKSWTDKEIWQALSKAEEAVGNREGTIFNLSVDTILALQDTRLKMRLRDFVGKRVAEWLTSRVREGADPEVVQSMVKGVYIEETKDFLAWYSLVDESEGGKRYYGSLDLYKLANYSGSDGDFCGYWGTQKRSATGGELGVYFIKGQRQRSALVDASDRAWFKDKGFNPKDGVCQDCGYEGVVADCKVCRGCNELYDQLGYNPKKQTYQLAA